MCDALVKWLLDNGYGEERSGYGATAEDIADALIESEWVTDAPIPPGLKTHSHYDWCRVGDHYGSCERPLAARETGSGTE